MQRPNSRTKTSGFTLIELMVATAIMTLLVMAVMTMTGNVLDVWSNASGKLSANAEARTALQYIGDDLETLVVRPKSQSWLHVTYDNNPTGTPDAYSARRIPSISMITATEHRPTSSDFGNICAVNYQLAFGNPIVSGANIGDAPPPIFALYRTLVEPQDTFNNILNEPYVNTPPPTGLLYNLIADAVSTSGGFVNFNNFLSSHIADLSIVFYAEDLNDIDTTTGRPKIKPIADGDGTPLDFVYADRIYILDGTLPANVNFGSIVYADIRMVVLSDNGVKSISNNPASTSRINDIIESEGTVFTRRVPIMSRH